MNKPFFISIGVGFIGSPLLLVPLGFFLYPFTNILIPLSLMILSYVTIVVIAAFLAFVKKNVKIVSGVVVGVLLAAATLYLNPSIVNWLVTWTCLTFGHSCP